MDKKELIDILNENQRRKNKTSFTKILTSIFVGLYLLIFIFTFYLILENRDNPLQLLDHSESIMVIVIGGYFGKSSVENFIKIKSNKKTNDEDINI